MNTNKNILRYESFNSINNCRICFENVDNVVNYCNCKNELAIIHHDCLKKWILLNIKENKESKFSCEIGNMLTRGILIISFNCFLV